jgi:hypothetical protein
MVKRRKNLGTSSFFSESPGKTRPQRKCEGWEFLPHTVRSIDLDSLSETGTKGRLFHFRGRVIQARGLFPDSPVIFPELRAGVMIVSYKPTDQRECKCRKGAVRRESFTWSSVGSYGRGHLHRDNKVAGEKIGEQVPERRRVA